MKSGTKLIQTFLTEIKSALRSTQEPVKIHDNENNLSHVVIIKGLVEENEDKKLWQEVGLLN